MELSLGELASLLKPDCSTPFVIGKAYLFRTIGYHWLGRVKAIDGKFLTLEEATWVADTGRYSEAVEGRITGSSSSELEPVNRDVVLNSDHITDATEYPYQIPRGVK